MEKTIRSEGNHTKDKAAQLHDEILHPWTFSEFDYGA